MSLGLSLYNLNLKKKIHFPIIGGYVKNNSELYILVEAFQPHLEIVRYFIDEERAFRAGLVSQKMVDVFLNIKEGSKFFETGIPAIRLSDKELANRLEDKVFVDVSCPIVEYSNNSYVVNRFRAKNIFGQYVEFQLNQVEKVFLDTHLIKIKNQICVMGTEEIFSVKMDKFLKQIWENDLVLYEGSIYIVRFIPYKGVFYLVNNLGEEIVSLEKALEKGIEIVGNYWDNFEMVI